jgi:hypothetical protein
LCPQALGTISDLGFAAKDGIELEAHEFVALVDEFLQQSKFQ